MSAQGPPRPAPDGQPERNGIPILRVLAGVAALLFAMSPFLGQWGFVDLVFYEVIAAVFAWYAAFGRRGLRLSP